VYRFIDRGMESGVAVPQSLGFGPESERQGLPFDGDSDSAHVLLLDCTLSPVLRGFINFVQFTLQIIQLYAMDQNTVVSTNRSDKAETLDIISTAYIN